MLVTPNGNALPLGSPAVWEIVAPGQLSEMVGADQVATAVQAAPAFRLMLPGQPDTTGGVASTTVTVKLQVEVLPLPSVAV